MDIKLSLRALRDSGLPIDWMTLKVGVDGITFSDWGCVPTERSEIKDYALEVLAPAVGTWDEEPIFLIADADLTDWTSLNRPLALLAERAEIPREIALRKWRYATLYEYVAVFVIPDFTQIQNIWEFDDLYYLQWIKSEWGDIEGLDSLPDDAKGGTSMEEAIHAELESLRVWLAGERLVLDAIESGVTGSR